MSDNRKFQTANGFIERRQQCLSSSLKVYYPTNPLYITRAEKQFMIDDDNRCYLDCINNVCHVGHCHPHVVEAATKQISLLNTNTRFLHENIINYAERLTSTLPSSLKVCFFVCSGSEANDLALRLAKAHTGNDSVICIEEAYHGTTMACQKISSYHKYTSDSGENIFTVSIPDIYRDGYKENAGIHYAREVEQRTLNTPSATFICESALSCAGQIILPEGYLAHAYYHVRKTGGVCIADEVQTGFGRFGTHFWAFESQGVVPDIVTMGKAMGNGFPLAAVVTTVEIEESLRKTKMQYFNTCGGNPVACAVGLAVLEVIDQENLQQNALEVGKYLLCRLQKLKDKYPIIGDVRGRGLFIGIELVTNRYSLEPAPQATTQICDKLRDLGVLISIDGPNNNVLKIKPPMCFTREDSDTLINALEIALETIALAFHFSEQTMNNIKAIDFVNEEYVRLLKKGTKVIYVKERAIITPLARDAAQKADIDFKVINLESSLAWNHKEHL